MKDIKNLYEKSQKQIPRYIGRVSKHRILVIAIIIGAAIAFSLIKTGSFIDIPRNEDRYNEEVLQINYKEIDSAILEQFTVAEQDGTIEVNSNFDPNRSNPFSE